MHRGNLHTRSSGISPSTVASLSSRASTSSLTLPSPRPSSSAPPRTPPRPTTPSRPAYASIALHSSPELFGSPLDRFESREDGSRSPVHQAGPEAHEPIAFPSLNNGDGPAPFLEPAPKPIGNSWIRSLRRARRSSGGSRGRDHRGAKRPARYDNDEARISLESPRAEKLLCRGTLLGINSLAPTRTNSN